MKLEPKLSRLARRVRGGERGITGLETAIVLIAFIVVAAVFAFAVLTTGLFSTEKTKQTAGAAVGAVSSTLETKGSVIATGNGTAVKTVKFRVKLAPGADAVGLTAAETLVTYTDASNDETATGDSPAATGDITWSVVWLLGSPSIVDDGELVEFEVTLRNAAGTEGLNPSLEANTKFSITVTPKAGAEVKITRNTPLEIKGSTTADGVMDLG